MKLMYISYKNKTQWTHCTTVCFITFYCNIYDKPNRHETNKTGGISPARVE